MTALLEHTYTRWAVARVIAQRLKQIAQYPPARDDAEESNGQLAIAAAYLAAEHLPGVHVSAEVPAWAEKLGKRHADDPMMQLEIAAALIIAEMERLDRAHWRGRVGEKPLLQIRANIPQGEIETFAAMLKEAASTPILPLVEPETPGPDFAVLQRALDEFYGCFVLTGSGNVDVDPDIRPEAVARAFRRVEVVNAGLGHVRPQRPPRSNNEPPVWEAVIEEFERQATSELHVAVLDDMRRRDAMGRATYREPLRPNNGRDPMVDLYQEVLDGIAYAKQGEMEAGQHTPRAWLFRSLGRALRALACDIKATLWNVPERGRVFTAPEAEMLTAILSGHHGEPVRRLSEFCTAIKTWFRAIEDVNRDVPEDAESKPQGNRYFLHLRGIEIDIKKSNLLSRLLHRGERRRTEKCPIHDGHWDGQAMLRGCEHKCGGTGWLPLPVSIQAGERE